MVSHLETGSDSPIGSDRDRGRDIVLSTLSHFPLLHFLSFSFPFSRLPNTPLRMTTQRMFG